VPAASEVKVVEPQIRVQTKAELLNEPSIEFPKKLRNVNNALARSRRQFVVYSQEKAVMDGKTNTIRIEAIKKARDEFRFMGGEDLREEIVRKADLINGSIYKSLILFQSGMEWKRDGTQRRLGKRLILGKGELTDQEIEAAAREETAVMRAPRGVEVERKKLENVIKLPEEPFSYFDQEAILPRKKEIKEVNPDEGVLFNAHLVALPAFEPNPATQILDQEEQVRTPLSENIIGFASRFLGMGAGNMRPSEIDELAERRQLLLAA
jgi:hypothetical protein